uniref:SB domain-containing protein n=1 Tax=Aegilops tauschii subsp. strangulata TaxID=200361 RepID=A0A453LLB6_AEGTS
APSPSPPPPASGAQYAHQFLNTALSQRGPSALPYAEDVKWLIRNHLVALADAFPSLHPKAALFTHNDGRAAHLLQADGTVPIHHAGATYNLPAVIWLPETYPRSPPLVFLSPTRDMLIKPPTTRSSTAPASSPTPPTSAPGSVAAPSPTPPPAHPAPPPAAASPAMRPEAVYAPVPRPYRFPASPQLAARQPPTEDPAEVFKRNAISKLVDTAYADAAALRTAREAEVDSLFAVQAELRGRGEAVNDGVRRITEEKETLERRLQDVVMATDVIEAWVAENRKGAADDATEAEGAIQPADVLSRQMLECTATDLALEDTIYALDKAVQEGSVPFDGYLRSVRALAREQFFQRVLCTKVNNAQQQAQVARMAARAPQYAS